MLLIDGSDDRRTLSLMTDFSSIMTGGSKRFYSKEVDSDSEGDSKRFCSNEVDNDFKECHSGSEGFSNAADYEHDGEGPEVYSFDVQLVDLPVGMPSVSQVFFGIDHPYIRHTFNERMASRREYTLTACCVLATIGMLCRSFNHAFGIPLLLSGVGWDTVYASIFFSAVASVFSLRNCTHKARIDRLAMLGTCLALPSTLMLSSAMIWCNGLGEGPLFLSVLATGLPLFHNIGSAVNLWVPAAGTILSWWAVIVSPFSNNLKFGMCCMYGFVFALQVLILTRTRTQNLIGCM